MTSPIIRIPGVRMRRLTIAEYLFGSGVQGAIYRPRDLSTLFQDSAGTTPVTAMEQPVGRMLDISGNGNHAFQATAGKRPVVSRRVNKVSSSFSSPTSGGTTAINDGTLDIRGRPATLYKPNTGTSLHYMVVGLSDRTLGYNTLSIEIKPAGCNFVGIQQKTLDGIWCSAEFNLIDGTVVAATPGVDASIEPIGDGWFLCKFGMLYSADTSASRSDAIFPTKNQGTWDVNHSEDGISGVYCSNFSYVNATDAHLPYQWVNTAEDYDDNAFKSPTYLKSDGAATSYSSATGGGGNAGFFFSKAITVLGGAGTARTLFSDAGTNTGYIVRLNTSNQLELAAGNGTAYTTIATAGTLAVGSTDIIQAWDDGTNLNVKIGAGPTASIARPAVAAGTAGYTMGQDNGASTGYFNGRVYSTVYTKDMAPTQVQRDAVAAFQRAEARMA